ncbi:MAG: NAD-dependent epimerase/dehydratase family protein [bacterium]
MKSKKRLLITGGLGFIGIHTVRRLYSKYEIVIIDFDDSPKSIRYKEELNKTNVEIYQKDIADSNTWTIIPPCDYILHAAAQVSAVISENDPVTDFKSNAYGTLLVAEYARKHSASVIYCNSMRIYDPISIKKEMQKGNKVSENCNTIEKLSKPKPPFALSKRMGELYLSYYANKYNFNVISHRMSSIVGPAQNGSKIHGWLVNIIKCAITGEEYTIYGDGKQTRDILYIDDFLDIIEMELENFKHFADGKFTVYNVGGGPKNELSILETIGILKKEYNLKLSYKFGKARQDEPKHYVSDISKIIRNGWRPKYKDPKQIINKLIDFYKGS